MAKQVAIGLLGTVLDNRGFGERRWNAWRPSLAICGQPERPLSRLELLHSPQNLKLAQLTQADIEQRFPTTQVRLHAIHFDDPWDFEQVYAGLHDFVSAYAFDPENEDYLVHITTGTHVAQICWFLLAESRLLPAQLLQSSPRRTESMPWGEVDQINLDLSRYDRLAQRFQLQQQEQQSFLKSGIATRNPAFNRMIEQIERVALRSTAPVLLSGPTGAGKSFLARRLFELKKSRHLLAGDFVEINCATLRGDSAMSALFGHVKGAFTGALVERTGLLRRADGGLLFLDEIGELGLDEQAMLLKAIEEKTFFPFGSDREVQSSFQLVCGTVRDLPQWVAEGRFREDLYARINLWSFELPGLAARVEDLEPNLDYELSRYTREQGERIRFQAEAKARYLKFATSSAAQWRGNFRELSASITRMATLAEQGCITEAVVLEEIGRLRHGWQADSAASSNKLVSLGLNPEELDLFDRLQLEAVLVVCGQSGSLSDAGRKLYGVSRQQKVQANDADRLRKYLARFGLDWAALQAVR